MRSNSAPSFIFLLLACCISVSCVSSRFDITKDGNIAPETGLLVRQTLQHDGIEREYFVYLPGSYNEGKALPVVIGHEGAGIVQEVGPGVSLVKPGDHVVLSFAPYCGHCYYCSTFPFNSGLPISTATSGVQEICGLTRSL